MSKTIARQSEFVTHDDGTVVVNRKYTNGSELLTVGAISAVTFLTSGSFFIGLSESATAFAYNVLSPVAGASMLTVIGLIFTAVVQLDSISKKFIADEYYINYALSKCKANGGKSTLIGRSIGVTFDPKTMAVLDKDKAGHGFILDSFGNRKLPTHEVRETVEHENGKYHVKTEYIETPLTQWGTMFSSASKLRTVEGLQNA